MNRFAFTFRLAAALVLATAPFAASLARADGATSLDFSAGLSSCVALSAAFVRLLSSSITPCFTTVVPITTPSASARNTATIETR